MKSPMRHPRPLLSLIVAAAVLLNGCAAFGKKEEPRLVATLESVQDDYSEAQLETEVTEDALNELVVSDVADLEQAYQAFAESVDRIQETGERLVIHADEMLFHGPSYLVESGKPSDVCVYPRPRQSFDVKAVELGDNFYPIADEGWQVKHAFRGYQFDISQIREYLSTNLTRSAVEALAQVIDKARVDGESLKESLEQVLTAIERAEMAQKQAQANASPPREQPAEESTPLAPSSD